MRNDSEKKRQKNRTGHRRREASANNGCAPSAGLRRSPRSSPPPRRRSRRPGGRGVSSCPLRARGAGGRPPRPTRRLPGRGASTRTAIGRCKGSPRQPGGNRRGRRALPAVQPLRRGESDKGSVRLHPHSRHLQSRWVRAESHQGGHGGARGRGRSRRSRRGGPAAGGRAGACVAQITRGRIMTTISLARGRRASSDRARRLHPGASRGALASPRPWRSPWLSVRSAFRGGSCVRTQLNVGDESRQERGAVGLLQRRRVVRRRALSLTALSAPALSSSYAVARWPCSAAIWRGVTALSPKRAFGVAPAARSIFVIWAYPITAATCRGASPCGVRVRAWQYTTVDCACGRVADGRKAGERSGRR